ncbi:MAG: UvrD-helicase domain-containing protein [Methanobacteriota archaeon]
MLDSPLSTLKPRQLEAIKHTQAPQLILAGAGTGKTTTITAKIAYIVEKENIDPSHILALTFSKEASRNPCVSVSSVQSVFYLTVFLLTDDEWKGFKLSSSQEVSRRTQGTWGT